MLDYCVFIVDIITVQYIYNKVLNLH